MAFTPIPKKFRFQLEDEGTSGDDYFTGDPGLGILFQTSIGKAGDDVFDLVRYDEGTQFNGGDGDDLYFFGNVGGIRFSKWSKDKTDAVVRFDGGDGTDKMQFSLTVDEIDARWNLGEVGGQFESVEVFEFSILANRLSGASTPGETIQLNGTGAADALHLDMAIQNNLKVKTKGGNDLLVADLVTENASNAAGVVVLVGGGGSDTIAARENDFDGKVVIKGGRGNDVIQGDNDTSERLFGNGGKDKFAFGASEGAQSGDKMTGGGGRDTFVFTELATGGAGSGGTANSVTDFSSNDRIAFSSLVGVTKGDLSFGAAPGSSGLANASLGLIYDEDQGLLSYQGVDILSVKRGTMIDEKQFVFDYDASVFEYEFVTMMI